MLKIELNGNLLTANDGIKIRLTKKKRSYFFILSKKNQNV